MDAVLSEAVPKAKPTDAGDSATNLAHWICPAVGAVIVTGILWRLIRYFAGFPIWGDEAMLLLNILERDYVGLTQHLNHSQVAPLLFLWLERTALVLFGSSEWSIHLFPALAGLLGFLIFWRMARLSFSPVAAGLAVAILAVSYYPVRHACEVKPYPFDLLFAATFAWLTMAHLRAVGIVRPASDIDTDQASTRWLIALAVAAPLAVFSSYPSAFVGGAVSLVLLPTLRSATWTQRAWFGVFNVCLVGSFLVHYGMVGHQQIDAAEAQRTREFLREYWKDAFPPEGIWTWPIWLVQNLAGNMLAYPVGASRGGSSATLLLVLTGSLALWRSGQRSLLALCWLPFALNLLAAVLGKYPFGSSARISQHLAPFICILMAHGFADFLDRFRSPDWRMRVHFGFLCVLLICGGAGIYRDLRQPFKTEHDRDIRLLARDLARQAGRGEPVLICHSPNQDVLAEFVWYMRTEIPTVRWLPDLPMKEPAATSCWLALCSPREPSVADVLAPVADAVKGWRVTETDVRVVPPENSKMATVYCRKVRLVRE